MSTLAWHGGLTALACVTLYFVPLVRVVPLADETSADADSFDPSGFALKFWRERLLPAADDTLDADLVLAALDTNAVEVGTTHGRRVGVSRGFFLFLKGNGVVVETTSKGVLVETPSGAELVLKTGPIFGSAVRDASGLLDASVAPSSRDYNALAEALSRLSEELVVPELEAIPVGTRIGFAGCAKVSNPDQHRPPLSLVPIRVEAL